MQLISWVPLGRWNYQPCCPPGLLQLRAGTLGMRDALGVIAFVLPAAFFWYAARRCWRWIAAILLVPYGIWFTLQIWTWWPPYIFGASAHWQAVYARAFAEATQALPRWGAHLPPDAVHLTLQALLLGVLLTGGRAVLKGC